MKTRFCLYCISALILAGCAQENEHSHMDSLAVSVSQQPFTDNGIGVKTTDKGYYTEFANGDAIGVIAIVNGSVSEVCNNLKFIYNGSGWISESNPDAGVPKIKEAVYLGYYPYDASMNGKKSITEVKDAFSPAADQSETYGLNDLMADMTSASGNSLNFNFTHQLSMIEVEIQTSNKYITDSGFEYSGPEMSLSDFSMKVDGVDVLPAKDVSGKSWRYLVKPGKVSVSLQYTLDDEQYKVSDISLETTAAKYKHLIVSEQSDPSKAVKRNIKTGDLYYSDGSIGPKEGTKENVIAVVFSTDSKRISNNKGMNHGLAVALKDAGEECSWGKLGRKETGSIDGIGNPYERNIVWPERMYSVINGSASTQWILYKMENESDSYTSADYAAFANVNEYGKDTPAPSSSTGWYLPATGEWWDLLTNLGGVDLSEYAGDKTANKTTVSVTGVLPKTVVDNINSYFSGLDENQFTGFIVKQQYWTSSQVSENAASAIQLAYSNLTISYLYKNTNDKGNDWNALARPILAF